MAVHSATNFHINISLFMLCRKCLLQRSQKKTKISRHVTKALWPQRFLNDGIKCFRSTLPASRRRAANPAPQGRHRVTPQEATKF